jgi:hypothetical protein
MNINLSPKIDDLPSACDIGVQSYADNNNPAYSCVVPHYEIGQTLYRDRSLKQDEIDRFKANSVDPRHLGVPWSVLVAPERVDRVKLLFAPYRSG